MDTSTLSPSIPPPEDPPFVGIGLQLEQKKEKFFVLQIAPNGPAEEAGLLPEDQILEIDSESIHSLNFNQVVTKLRGPEGSVVLLSIQRQPNEILKFSLTRKKIPMATMPLLKESPLVKRDSSTEKIPKSIFQEIPGVEKTPSELIPVLEALPSKPSPEKKTQRIHKKTTGKLKAKASQIIKIFFDDREEIPPLPTETSTTTLQEVAVDLPSPPQPYDLKSELQSLETRIETLQENLEEPEEQTTPDSQNQITSNAIPSESLLPPPPINESLNAIKKITNRLRKITDRLSRKTNRVIQTLFDHLETQKTQTSEANIDDINLTEEFTTHAKKAMTHFFDTLTPASTVAPNENKESLKKKTQRLMRIFYESPQEQKAEIGTASLPNDPSLAQEQISYWYKIEADPKAIQERLEKEKKEKAKEKAKQEALLYKKALLAEKKATKKAPAFVPNTNASPKKDFWNEIGMQNKGPASGWGWEKIVAGMGALLFVFFWLFSDTSTVPPPPVIASQKPNIVKSSTTATTADLIKKEKPLQPAVQAEIFIKEKKAPDQDDLNREREMKELYFREESEEVVQLKQILQRFEVDLENLDQFPISRWGELSKNELFLLIKFQQQKRDLKWAKEELAGYETLDFKDKTKLAFKRKRLLQQKEKIAFSILLVLGDPDTPLAIHKELSQILAMTGETQAFETLVWVREQEKVLEKNIHLLYPLACLGNQKAFPHILKTLDSPHEEEVEGANALLSRVVFPGCEAQLSPYLYKPKPKVVEMIRKILIQLDTKSSKNYLAIAKENGVIASVSLD